MKNGLKNKVFISTRPENRDDHLREMLKAEGAELYSFPMVEIECIPYSPELKDKLEHILSCEWFVFTSANGVRCFLQLVQSASYSLQILQKIKIAVIGEKTAASIQEVGFTPHIISKRTSEGAAGFADDLLEQLHTSTSVCLIQGNLANSVLEEKLAKKHTVNTIIVYKTQPPVSFDPKIGQRIKNGNYNELIFTSPSGIKHLLNLLPDNEEQEIHAICIGRTTAHFALSVGIKPSAIAEKQSSVGIFNCLKELYQTK